MLRCKLNDVLQHGGELNFLAWSHFSGTGSFNYGVDSRLRFFICPTTHLTLAGILRSNFVC